MYKRIENVDEVLKASHDKQILILKHSTACPISRKAKSEVDRFLEQNKDMEAYLVVVQQQRPVSNELARKLGVVHESPQLLFIRDGAARKVLTHSEIRHRAIEQEVME